MSFGRREIGAFITILVTISYASGDSTRRVYPLPALPEMRDYLSDGIVLPRNHDRADVTVIDVQSRDTLATCSVSNENEFRLSEGNCTLPEVKPGMALEVSVEATVVIVSEKYSLLLPIIDDLGQQYFLITSRSDYNHRTISNIFIYPSKPNTSLQICINQLDKSGGQMNNFSEISPRIPGPRNCSNITLFNYEGLLLNDTAAPFAMEIRANLPFGILEWYRVNASDYARNGLQFADPPGKLLIIIWQGYSPLNAWGKTFMLPPTDNNLIRKLYLIPETNSCRISIMRENDSTIKVLNWNLTTVTIDTGGWVYLNSSCRLLPRYRVETVDGRYWSSWLSLTSLEGVPTTETSENTSQNYQWIFVNDSATLYIVCAKYLTKAIFLMHDRQVVLPLNVSEMSGTGYAYKMYKVLKGVYTVQYDHECLLWIYQRQGMTMNIILSPRTLTVGADESDVSRTSTLEISDSSLNYALLHSEIKNRESSLSDKIIQYSTDNNSSQSNTNLNTTRLDTKIQTDGDSENYSNHTIPEQLIDQVVQNKENPPNLSNGLTAIFNGSMNISSNIQNDTRNYIHNKKLNVGNFNNSYSRKEVPEMQIDNNTHDNSTIETTEINQSENTSALKDKQQYLMHDNRSETRHDKTNSDYSSNDKYKAVVDIVEHGDGTKTHTINKVPKDSSVHPSYGHKATPSDRYIELNNDKSLIAIIISLCSALLAVVAIIVIFLLIEFFSKRRQIRKTRIRPFVSYY